MLSKTKGSIELPEYFNEISRSIEVAKNLKISLIGRQALISLKLYASTPSYRKHTDDVNRLKPTTAEITEAVLVTIQSPVMFLLAMNILLLIVGMFMDIISATMILGPVFLPMLDAFHVNWMHFGLILTVNLAIGYCTPPMGVSLYITGAISNKDLIYVSKAVIPFIAIQVAVLFLITYFPDAVLWLPRMMGYLQ